MDLLFHRYADPFSFINAALSSGSSLYDIAYHAVKAVHDDDLYRLYLSCTSGGIGEDRMYHFSPPDSFAIWKEQLTGGAPKQEISETAKTEIHQTVPKMTGQEAINMAENILANFIPPKKGGNHV